VATDETRYISYGEAVLIQIELMRLLNESRFGVFDRALIESALARPQQAAIYENADIIRQAATLLYGLIKNHPWVGGNKRTATALMRIFLKRNHYRLTAPVEAIVNAVFAIESDEWQLMKSNCGCANAQHILNK
jgi:death-on-curing protein